MANAVGRSDKQDGGTNADCGYWIEDRRRTTAMSTITRLALDILHSTSAATGLKVVACNALLSALEAEVSVPTGTHMAVWHYLLNSDPVVATLHRHHLLHPEVARDAVRILLNADSGDAAQELALSVLRGQNAAELGDMDLQTLVDRILDEGRGRRVAWLIEQVHEHRGIRADVLTHLRDRLAGARDPAARIAAVAVGSLLPRLDLGFAGGMLEDAAPPVRAAAAEALEAVPDIDRTPALLLVRGRLPHESHRLPLSALYSTLGSLLRSGAPLGTSSAAT